MGLIVLTISVVALAMVIMAVGLFFKRPCLRGSCGGPRLFDSQGEPLTCNICPHRQEPLTQDNPSRKATTGTNLVE